MKDFKIVLFIAGLICLFQLFNSCTNTSETNIIAADNDPKIKRFNNITFEMSLKPFKKNNQAFIDSVSQEIFKQWSSLIRHTDTVSIMLWTADGSEILDYSGQLNQPLEWAMYIGNPNTEYEVNSFPDENLSLHERAFTYMDNPPSFTYADLKYIVSALKREGKTLTGKPIRVGATFDPGPEFAKSEFKYKKHPEICMAATMGEKTFVVSYATLNADNDSYAGFPQGIEQNTPLGTFFGRQSQHFLSDLGFDYLWLSNGFGFGMETWKATGAVFDGESFYPEKILDIREKIIEFWELFRNECPDFRIETRGTNLSTGIDLAADGVDLSRIYNGGFNLLPPPNSPWAALNGDFGLELTGYMSRIAELPDSRYLFRYYTHDPWWANSPWLDRYGRNSHDIYLPMAISRINNEGEVKNPTHLNFLTIDNSYGDMPLQVPDEVISHILQARRMSPDKPGPVVWIYPFEEYHEWATNQRERLAEMYYGDWLIRQAINEGFPINTVVSTKNYTAIEQSGQNIFDESVLVTIIPPSGSELENQLIEFVKNGGKLIIYGPVVNAGKNFLNFLNIEPVTPLSGEFQLNVLTKFDNTEDNSPMSLRHIDKMSGGGIETIMAKQNTSDTKVYASVNQADKKRDVIVFRQNKEWNGGAVCYVRGTNSASYKGGHLLTPDNPKEWFSGPSLLRYSLGLFDFSIVYDKKHPDIKNPVNCISRNDNAFWFSGYVPNLTVEQRFRFPQGAPIFTGWETEIKEGWSTYRFPKAFFEECRIFVEQESGIISCFEIPRRYKKERRIQITGLSDSKIRFYPPESFSKSDIQVFLNTNYPFKEGKVEPVASDPTLGYFFELENVTGQLVIAW